MVVSFYFGVEKATCFKWLQNGHLLRSPGKSAQKKTRHLTCVHLISLLHLGVVHGVFPRVLGLLGIPGLFSLREGGRVVQLPNFGTSPEKMLMASASLVETNGHVFKDVGTHQWWCCAWFPFKPT